jgi:hypothetical protein
MPARGSPDLVARYRANDCQKANTIDSTIALFREGDPEMRIAHVIFVGSVATLAALTAPVLANHSTAQKTDDRSSSSSCHAYQQAVDGTWTELPCAESGSNGQTQHKSPAKSGEDAPR